MKNYATRGSDMTFRLSLTHGDAGNASSFERLLANGEKLKGLVLGRNAAQAWRALMQLLRPTIEEPTALSFPVTSTQTLSRTLSRAGNSPQVRGARLN
jgi:hypothetical protein